MKLFDQVLHWIASHPDIVAKIVLGSLLLAFISILSMVFAIVRMSPDYFMAPMPPIESWRRRHPMLRVLARVLKIAIGLAILLTGMAMLVLPGQGLLMILIGVSLLEFPGKRNLELKLIRNRHVLKTVNWIRARAKQAPLIVN